VVKNLKPTFYISNIKNGENGDLHIIYTYCRSYKQNIFPFPIDIRVKCVNINDFFNI